MHNEGTVPGSTANDGILEELITSTTTYIYTQVTVTFIVAIIKVGITTKI